MGFHHGLSLNTNSVGTIEIDQDSIKEATTNYDDTININCSEVGKTQMKKM